MKSILTALILIGTPVNSDPVQSEVVIVAMDDVKKKKKKGKKIVGKGKKKSKKGFFSKVFGSK
tara:strand:- start:1252 stop:1440 length:189 start_codon:yes stop_codon:yes gene_type:complete